MQTTNASVDYGTDEIIPPEDFEAAISACREDPKLDVFFKTAPYGAKLYIGLCFYRMHFNQTWTDPKVKTCLAEIEPSLKTADIGYLLSSPVIDAESKEYLRALLRRDTGADKTEASGLMSPRGEGKRPVIVMAASRESFHLHETEVDNPRMLNLSIQASPRDFKNEFPSSGGRNDTVQVYESERRGWSKDGMTRAVAVAAFVATICCVAVGLWFISAHFSARCDELKTMIIELKNNDNSKVEHTKVGRLADRMDEIEAQATGRIKALEDGHAAFKTTLGSVTKRIGELEEIVTEDEEQCNRDNKKLEEKCVELSRQITELSRKEMGQHGTFQPLAQLPAQTEVDVPQQPEKPIASPSETLEDLQRQLADKSREVKNLVKNNPACYINPRTTSIINVAKTSATDSYSSRSKTLVRRDFYCKKCGGGSSATCNVCGQRSFNSWREAMDNVEVTTKTNRRIDELRNEMASLKKRIKALGQ